MSRLPALAVAVTLAFLAAGCTPHAASPPKVTLSTVTVPVHTSAKLDLLFMMDNSPSMGAMQEELRRHFGDLLQQLAGTVAGHALDLHVGVVTSDYGAGHVPNLAGGCDASPGGQRGRLQAVGAAADPSCVAPTGAPFIRYRQSSDGTIDSNLPSGTDLLTAFTCMASVGSTGCGFEHQLESVYAALRDDSFNAGFVRDDAQLVVVFVTNEDDGSAPPASDIYNPDPSLLATYGAYDTFRQTRFGVACGNPLMLPSQSMGGPLTDCVPAPALSPADIGQEYDVSRYVALFTQPRTQGGVKDDPRDVMLVGVMPPTTPFTVEQIAVGTGNGVGAYPNPAAYQPCPAGTPSTAPECMIRLQHACQNHVAPGFFGDPPIRLASVIDKVALHSVSNICGDDPDVAPSFGGMMQGIGRVMATDIDGGCLGHALADAAHPACTVTAGAATLPACAGATTSGCWLVADDPRCPAAADASGKMSAPRLALRGVSDGTTVQASCAVRVVE